MKDRMTERVLLTVLCETALEGAIMNLLRSCGASGFSVSRAEGDPEAPLTLVVGGTHVRIETLVTEATSEKILDAIEQQYMVHRSLIVWKQKVEVLRPSRFT